MSSEDRFVTNWLRCGELTESGFSDGGEITTEEWCLHEIKRLAIKGLRPYMVKKTDDKDIQYVALRLRKVVEK